MIVLVEVRGRKVREVAGRVRTRLAERYASREKGEAIVLAGFQSIGRESNTDHKKYAALRRTMRQWLVLHYDVLECRAWQSLLPDWWDRTVDFYTNNFLHMEL